MDPSVLAIADLFLVPVRNCSCDELWKDGDASLTSMLTQRTQTTEAAEITKQIMEGVHATRKDFALHPPRDDACRQREK